DTAPWLRATNTDARPGPVGRAGRPATRGNGRDGGLGALLDLLGELRGDRVQVTDDSEVGEVGDRCLGVLVDRDDVLRGLHTGTVLDRTGDPERDVQVRADCLTGLTDLELVRVPPGVDDGAGSTDGTTEGV